MIYRWQDVFSNDQPLIASLVRKRKKGWESTREELMKLVFENTVDSWVLEELIKEADKKIRECETFLKPPNKTLDIAKAKEYPIGDLMGQPGVNVSSNRVKYKCILHNEKTESFVWYKNNNSYYCYGCGKGGDVINLYMNIYKTNFVDAVKKLS